MFKDMILFFLLHSLGKSIYTEKLWKPGQIIMSSSFWYQSRADLPLTSTRLITWIRSLHVIIIYWDVFTDTRNDVWRVFRGAGQLSTRQSVSPFKRHRCQYTLQGHIHSTRDGDWQLHQPFGQQGNREVEKRTILLFYFLLCPGHSWFCALDVVSRLLFDVCVLHSSYWRENFLFGKTVEEKSQHFQKMVECWERHYVSNKTYLAHQLSFLQEHCSVFKTNNHTFWLTFFSDGKEHQANI